MAKLETDSRLIQDYKYGFVTEVEEDTVPKGLNEDIIQTISEKKLEPEWMLAWRLKAYRHWLKKRDSPLVFFLLFS